MTFCFSRRSTCPPRAAWSAIPGTWRGAVWRQGTGALIVTSALPGLPARERDEWGLEIYRLPALPVMGGRFPVCAPFAPAADLWAQGIDFAVIQTRMYIQSVWAARQCRRRGIPALVIDHSHRLHDARRAGRCAGALVRTSGLRRHPPVQVSLLRRLRRCLPLAEDLRHHGGWHAAQRRGPRGTLGPGHGGPPSSPWRQKLEVPADGHLIAFVGRLIPEKGALRLAEAVQQLPAVCWLWPAPAPEEEALRALGGPVRVLGALPHPQIVQLLHQADCYCLPTEYAEGFPTTLLEAAACGCPSSAPHRRHRRAAARRKLRGVSGGYPARNTDAGLQQVLRDPDAARTRAAHALENLTARFTWQAVYTALLQAAQDARARAKRS